jgi:hypothetical protein
MKEDLITMNDVIEILREHLQDDNLTLGDLLGDEIIVIRDGDEVDAALFEEHPFVLKKDFTPKQVETLKKRHSIVEVKKSYEHTEKTEEESLPAEIQFALEGLMGPPITKEESHGEEEPPHVEPTDR